MAVTLGRKVPLIFRVHRGAPFLTLLRHQWMAMRRRAGLEAAGSAIAKQLLGTIVDIVSPGDNIDLVAGQDFYYLDVPKSGHVNVLEANDSPADMRRHHIIARALTATLKQLERLSILPSAPNLQAIDDTVTDVVFAIHGIRDEGY
ncbi:hypothetical protein AB4Y44_10035 [Paraburkholderia sp. BR10937]|uniref:hypothetical protein n=1 Tax=Paraburkholderia sp. BR10937 TaxID=3236994 RepID=UPI0034D2B31A